MASRLVRRSFYSVFALVVGFCVGLFALGYTPLLAATCPACFGLKNAGNNIYVDTRDHNFDHEMNRRYDLAKARVVRGFGPVQRQPRVIACLSETCHKLMGDPGPKALTYGSHVFYLSPRGLEVDIIAHELTHIELHHKIGLKSLRHFPAWVDEGIAVYVSQDARFDLNPETCVIHNHALPISAREWGRQSGQAGATLYRDAGCTVSKWMKSHPISGLEGLIATHLNAHP